MKTHVNLLPWRSRRTQIIRSRVRQWVLPWCVAVTGVALLFAVQLFRHHAVRQKVGQLKEQYAPIEALAAEIKTLHTRLAEVSGQAKAIAKLEGSRPALTLLGFVSQSAGDCRGQLHVENLSLQTAVEKVKSGDKTAVASDAGAMLVTIKGVAVDNLSVARFVSALGKTKSFDRVELKSSKEQPLGTLRVCSYLIECGY